ncbi:MAG TPA: hypothetical protein VNX69_04225 [Steroidobacteraceae bacterium]|jgi:hypothetical protein|nr:hypothetical protein [Steroidobacteraceae bacterium]
MKGIRKFALASAALLVASLGVGSISALAQFVGPTPLTLINGWNNAPFGTSIATVEEVAGIVQLRGAIATSGASAEPFVLPPSFRPAGNVYVPIDLCNATKGRLFIQPSGVVIVQAEGGVFSNAQCFTSLDGASFVLNSAGPSLLTLINGWTNGPFGTSKAAARNTAGIVHLRGAIATSGTNAEPFVLPAAFRPATDVYVPVDLCNATNGRLFIQASGAVTVQAQGGVFSNAQCFTSLDGAWFVAQDAGFKALTLINGWKGGPFSTHTPEAGNAYGIVYFHGAIASGTNAAPFVLPPSLTPVTNVYIPVDLCNATNGRLIIQSSGAVTIQAEGGTFTNAQCFTSLDGVSFVQ